MKKSYIFWWVVSAYCLFGFLFGLYHAFYFPDPLYHDYEIMGVAIAIIVALISFYVGYRRYQEYQEYQEDRKIRNEYYKSNTKKGDE